MRSDFVDGGFVDGDEEEREEEKENDKEEDIGYGVKA